MKKTRMMVPALAASIAIATPLTYVPVATAGVAQPPAVSPQLPPSQITADLPANVQEETGYLTSQDGKGTQIFWRSQKVPNAQGTVVLVHGAAEHSGRYDYVANRLLQAGYNVYRNDHRGHGKTAQANEGTLGYVDDFHNLVDDMNLVVQKAKAENPNQKTFMLGHSMGALAAQFYGIKYPGQIDGFVTNGGGAPFNKSGRNEPGQNITPRDITDAQRAMGTNIWDRLPVDQLTTFNQQLANMALPNNVALRLPSLPLTGKIKVPNAFSDGVASDPAVTAEYETDPLVSKNLTLGMIQQMAVSGVYSAINASNFTAPTLIMHGTQDGLVPNYFAQSWYNGIGSQDKELINWEGQYHEVFNEPAKVEAMDKTIEWFNNRV